MNYCLLGIPSSFQSYVHILLHEVKTRRQREAWHRQCKRWRAITSYQWSVNVMQMVKVRLGWRGDCCQVFWILKQSLHRINCSCVQCVNSSETHITNVFFKWQHCKNKLVVLSTEWLPCMVADKLKRRWLYFANCIRQPERKLPSHLYTIKKDRLFLTIELLPWLQTSWRDSGWEVCFGVED